ncbi:hypothetical protein ACLM5J_09915 [Nocardioides sp. Bht2]|uniref:hypothetical protein n=1 Tax=Nocardioides sp. Bht2 TaxID=3392297 RepID=UPI0039B541B4
MTWDTFHRRGEVLRRIIETADLRRDGELPWDVDGARVVFSDDIDLLGALQLRWHTALAGQIETALADQPVDLEAAVVGAWRAAVADLPGVRLILDAYRAHPADAEMERMMSAASAKERQMMALMAGLASRLDLDAHGARRGELLERKAREGLQFPAAVVPTPRGFLDRLKAALAA